jgi:hypothetical protein
VTYRVNGTQTVPLVDLGAILQGRPFRLGTESVEGVLTERGLFVVSEVLGNEDSVVKPIDFLTGRNLYQGATISGQGNVVLILDAGALRAAASANFHVSDPEAKVFFCGDVGAALLPPGHGLWVGGRQGAESAKTFDEHIQHARFFHQRWMPF